MNARRIRVHVTGDAVGAKVHEAGASHISCEM